MKDQDSVLSAEEITRGLGARFLGCRVVYHESISSTNDVAKKLADEGGPEGTVVLAEEQTAGRGRFGRSWSAPARTSILMSLILRPMLAPHQIARVTMAVSLGMCEAIQSETGLYARVKWPNDIVLNGKKCAGILAEAETVGDNLEFVVVGFGINVNFSAATAMIPEKATTIADEVGHSISREKLLRAILIAVEKYYLRLQAGEDLCAEWAERLVTLGQHLRVQMPWGEEEGIAERVDEDGALFLRRADDSFARLVAGEVTLARDVLALQQRRVL